MVDFILNALVYVLAIYGVIEIIKTIFCIMSFDALEKEDVYIIIDTDQVAKDKIEAMKQGHNGIIVADWHEFKELVEKM
ncbi:MAG: hypothetical protein HFJ50_07735 [Clostridia bacterium]|jgi:hypothetical protein|nr:hypothetical protein [Clostridia bacterium]